MHRRVSSTFIDNILIWDRASLIFILIIGYDIDFLRLNLLEMYIRAFGETTTSFCLS